MKAADYIVEFLIGKNIKHVFGYPGGMVIHLMNSLDKYKDHIRANLCYHEQGAAFAACGYAQATHLPGVAYATSGPGATNLVTGIANAYFDSIPCVFITGQVNTYESKGDLPIKQKGFQEMDVVSLVGTITKYAVQVKAAQDLVFELEKAYDICIKGRPGPVLLDIPMDIQRSDIDLMAVRHYVPQPPTEIKHDMSDILERVYQAKRPCVLLGAGIKSAGRVREIREILRKKKIPVVSSMLGVDIMPRSDSNYFGFVGAYGDRCANFIVNKCDVLISVGSRLDCRQTGTQPNSFAPNSLLIRFDIDPDELSNRILDNEIQIECNMDDTLAFLEKMLISDSESWMSVCCEIQNKLKDLDKSEPTELIRSLSNIIPDYSIITTDVGQNQVWTAQAFFLKENQEILFSGGHGAMGYSLPAAIGAHLGGRGTVFSFNGDGGIQMNMQELQTIAQNNFPIKIVVFNNYALGMIRHFQEMYFESNFFHTTRTRGFTSPNFDRIAHAYGIEYHLFDGRYDVLQGLFQSGSPLLLEIPINSPTYVFPKLAMGRPNQDQDPLLERELYKYLAAL